MQNLQRPTRAARNRLVIICSKANSAEMAYLPLMMATISAALGMEVELYFTLWGLSVVARKTTSQLEIGPGTGREGLSTIKELIAKADAAGVKFYACGPSMQLMGLVDDDLIPEVDGVIASTTYLDLALIKKELYMICLTDFPLAASPEASRAEPRLAGTATMSGVQHRHRTDGPNQNVKRLRTA